ncbi:TrkH family potassium uptake protein [Bacillus fonticola]|uniref:TrkH family potassium uptake protein n=1 Tax=Bacillus fonticola TaxID=2728853 RepID=UPI001475AE0F|nr:TrkH family potassium uptake protein [Bacillus fonticola]
MRHTFMQRFNRLTPFQVIAGYYFLAVSFSTIILSLPFARREGMEWSLLDAVFTAVSAVSVTGLTTVSIVDTFTVPGYFLLMFVLQFGGIGIMTLGTFFWMLFGKKIGLKERRLMMADQNQVNLSGVVNLLKQILVIILVIELIGALILGTYFLRYYDGVAVAFLQGLFMSVSATTNGGFDITGNSLQDFSTDYFVQFINILLISLGAIGFPVLIEVKEFLKRREGQPFRFSLFTKLTTTTFAALLVVGTLMILLLESRAYLKGLPWHEAFFYAFFQSATTRSGGLATLDVSQFTEATHLFMSALMFIGASPSSVGGGIRTTTFALCLIFLFHFAKGSKSIKLFKREVYTEDIYRAVAVFIVAVFIFFASVLILSITEDQPLVALIFEVASAFGTTGLTLGITPDLSVIGKILIMLLMFIGRVGLLSFLFALGGNDKKLKYSYPKERVIIG